MIITERFLKINHRKHRRGLYPIDTLVIHVTEGSAESVRQWFNDPASQVSSHYMTTKAGGIDQFVSEEDEAFANGRVDHPTAAVVRERLSSNPNWWTISIENEGSGKEELTDPQRKALLWLIRDIQKRHPLIKSDRRHILGHHEIFAPKPCPGAISVDRIVAELNAPDFSDVRSSSSSTAPP